MHRQTLAPAVAAAVCAATVTLAGCTAAGSGPTGSRAPASSGNATEPSNSSRPAACSGAVTTLTYHRRTVLIGGVKIIVPAGGAPSARTAVPDTVVLRAAATGPGPRGGLVHAVERHWYTHAASLGSSTSGLGGTVQVRQPRSTTTSAAYVDYDTVTEYTGTYTNVCGGQRVDGRYLTFGDVHAVNASCGKVASIGRRFCR